MKMQRKLVYACLCALAVLAACSKPAGRAAGAGEESDAPDAALGGEEAAPAEDVPGRYVMRIGHAQTEESPRHRSLLLFKEQVEANTGGMVTVRGGDLEFVPKITLLGLPLIADTLSDARRLCYSDFVRNMLGDAETRGMLVLAVGDDSGFRQITNSVHPVTKPADLKGLRIRAPQIVATVNFFTELGASATVVPFTKLYTELAEGRVAGQENPLALIDSSRFYEVQKYCTIINYQFFPELMYVNLDWWTALPEDFRSVITAAARRMMDENARITDAENEAYIRHIRQEGCEVVTLSAGERAAFLPYAERVWEKYVDEGYATREELEAMLAVVGKRISW